MSSLQTYYHFKLDFQNMTNTQEASDSPDILAPLKRRQFNDLWCFYYKKKSVDAQAVILRDWVFIRTKVHLASACSSPFY